MLKFRKLKLGDTDFYQLYDRAYSWDKNKYCFQKKELPEFMGLFSEYYALYEDEKFIGYGILNLKICLSSSIYIRLEDSNIEKIESNNKSDQSKINIAYIINPLYRNQGYGTILFNELVQQAESKTNYDIIEVNILKKNLPSISLIEKTDFDFKCFDDEKIIFQKVIKK